jgi:hypothetical protein
MVRLKLITEYMLRLAAQLHQMIVIASNHNRTLNKWSDAVTEL